MSDEGTDAANDSTVVGNRRQQSPESRRNWFAVARKDFADAGRSWQLYALGGGFMAVLTLGGTAPIVDVMTSGPPPGAENRSYSARIGMQNMTFFADLIVPLVALMLGYMAIVGERERGSLRSLLALPVSRYDVVIGTVLGRIGVIWVTLLVGLMLAAVPMWLLYDSMDLIAYAGFAASILLFAAVFVAMAVGISAAASTRGRAIGISLSTFTLVTFMWDQIVGLIRIATGVTVDQNIVGPDTAPGWFVFLDRARPGRIWRIVVTDWVVPVLSKLGRGDDTFYLSPTTSGHEPFYLDTWFLAIILLAWGVVPLLVGYWRFQGADIE